MRRAGRGAALLVVAGMATAMTGCGSTGPTATLTPSPPGPATTGTATPSASHREIGRDWAEAAVVEQPAGDPTITTPPYQNPGSLGHPGHYQGGEADLLDVGQGGPGLIAVGFLDRDIQADAWHSADGSTWTRVPDFPAQPGSLAVAVASTPTTVVAVGSAGPRAAAWTSADGIRWQAAEASPALTADVQIRMTSVVSWKGGFVAGGYVGSIAGPIRAAFWTSADGRTWERDADAPAFVGARVSGLAAMAGGGLVAVGAAGDAKTATGAAAWASEDGRTWQRVADGPALAAGVMNAIAAGPAALVAVGSDLDALAAMAWTSPDGKAWMRVPSAPSLDNFGLKIEMRDVAFAAGMYVAVGHLLFGQQFSTAVIWTSPDGSTWTRANEPASFGQGKIYGVSGGGPGIVAVGTFGAPDFFVPRVWVSPPG